MEIPDYDRRWAWGVRLTALICIFPMLIATGTVFLPRLWSPCVKAKAVAWLVVILPAALPYLHILYRVRLRGQPDKRGLTLAVGVGSLVGALGILLVGLAIIRNAGGWAALAGALLIITQSALVLCAIKTYYSMEREENDGGSLAGGFGGAAAYLALAFVMAVGIPGVLPSGSRTRRAAEAVIVLRTLNAAEADYAKTYGQGYSPSLRELGPPPAGASPGASSAHLIDSVLAGGRKNMYTFTYGPGPRDAEAKITAYILLARPGDPPCKGWPSFYTSESGIIRSTSEDRPATENDAPISE